MCTLIGCLASSGLAVANILFLHLTECQFWWFNDKISGKTCTFHLSEVCSPTLITMLCSRQYSDMIVCSPTLVNIYNASLQAVQ